MEDKKPIEIDLRKYNKISFDLILEGTSSDDLGACKFVIEDKEMSFMFDAAYDEESNSFNITIPPLKTNLQESKLYKSKLQVTVDGQVYEPLETYIKGKESPKIKISNFQNESVEKTSKESKPIVRAVAESVTISAKDISKAQLFEQIRSLKNHINSIEKDDGDEATQKKKELIDLYKAYKNMKD